jgi:ApbE superfamily uncharacterized protein (UPF0280 family)
MSAATRLSDGRLHLQDGPIDLVIHAEGPQASAALAAAARRFEGLLASLCDELPALRAPSGKAALKGPVARRMGAAVAPYAAHGFITPMAAVAGAVADEVLAAMREGGGLTRGYVNNGGDIAVHVGAGERLTIGVVDRPHRPQLFARALIEPGVGGVATSGAPGRGFSLGIADAVTILSGDVASADAAATIVANAVDLPERAGIVRLPARAILPDSDLGDLPVTRFVLPLTPAEIDAALAAGAAVAQALVAEGRIVAALLRLQGETRTVGAAGLALPGDRSHD